MAHIRSRGEEAQAKRQKKHGEKARRWVVERTHRWFNRFRSILTRWSKKAKNSLAMLYFVCGLVTYRAALFSDRQLALPIEQRVRCWKHPSTGFYRPGGIRILSRGPSSLRIYSQLQFHKIIRSAESISPLSGDENQGGEFATLAPRPCAKPHRNEDSL